MGTEKEPTDKAVAAIVAAAAEEDPRSEEAKEKARQQTTEPEEKRASKGSDKTQETDPGKVTSNEDGEGEGDEDTNPVACSKPKRITMVSAQRDKEQKQTVTAWGSKKGAADKPPTNMCAQRFRKAMKRVRNNLVFKVTLNVSLAFALFGGSFWVILSVPDDPGTLVLDTLMIIVAFAFVLDVVVNWASDRHEYPWSFFFWMDILGTVSMVFEISFLLGDFGNGQGGGEFDTVLLRTARAAKVGARAGRFVKLLKCLSVMFSGGKGEEKEEARVLSKRLMLTLSTKVSMLTIALVLVVPLFQIGQYPEADLSMAAWGENLEYNYKRAYDWLVANELETTTNLFKLEVDEMSEFFDSVNYYPYELEGFPVTVQIGERSCSILGGGIIGKEPVKKMAITKQKNSECLLLRHACDGGTYVYYNFEGPKRLEAGMDVLMIVFIISVMLLISFDLSQTLQTTVVKPMERMMSVVRQRASEILGHVQEPEAEDKTSEDSSHHSDEDVGGLTEVEILELALQKISKLVQISMMNNSVDDEGLGDEEKGVLIDMMGVQAAKVVDVSERIEMDNSTHLAVAKLPPGVDKELLESWNLDVLEQTPDVLKQILIYFIFDSHIGRSAAQQWGDINIFNNFHGMVKDGYTDQPYHCYTHAVDVSHTVHGELLAVKSHRWLSDVEVYALLISALCHDLGHAGKTNLFLVEVTDELALRYNDTSPLENMHCARMFDICTNAEANVFGKMSKDDYKKARKVCIESILHTDNANHFEMVKDIQRFSEMAGELCEAQAAEEDDILPEYQTDVLHHNTLLWCELFLHMADISNPLKPFKACHAWAQRILDEFFTQGDEEKRLGIPVGMLNDRDKINRPGSQHGFINFLVAPLVLGAVRIFPGLHPLSSQMASNLREWRILWVEDAKPTPEEIAKRDADVEKVREKAEDLFARCGYADAAPAKSPRMQS